MPVVAFQATKVPGLVLDKAHVSFMGEKGEIMILPPSFCPDITTTGGEILNQERLLFFFPLVKRS